MNEAEAVNAQRDAHMPGGSVLERGVRSLEEMRRGWSPESGGWGGADRDASRIAELERQRDAAIGALDMRDDVMTLATLRGDAWRAQAVKAETERDAARAEAARHAGRLIVAREERDAARAAELRAEADRSFWRIQAHSTLWARIGSWLRAKAGR